MGVQPVQDQQGRVAGYAKEHLVSSTIYLRVLSIYHNQTQTFYDAQNEKKFYPSIFIKKASIIYVLHTS